jgi:hypothetical protein
MFAEALQANVFAPKRTRYLLMHETAEENSQAVEQMPRDGQALYQRHFVYHHRTSGF